jgi:hypothetical protein
MSGEVPQVDAEERRFLFDLWPEAATIEYCLPDAQEFAACSLKTAPGGFEPTGLPGRPRAGPAVTPTGCPTLPINRHQRHFAVDYQTQAQRCHSPPRMTQLSHDGPVHEIPPGRPGVDGLEL